MAALRSDWSKRVLERHPESILNAILFTVGDVYIRTFDHIDRLNSSLFASMPVNNCCRRLGIAAMTGHFPFVRGISRRRYDQCCKPPPFLLLSSVLSSYHIVFYCRMIHHLHHPYAPFTAARGFIARFQLSSMMIWTRSRSKFPSGVGRSIEYYVDMLNC